MMETFVKSVDIEREQYNLLLNNKPVDVIEIWEDSEELIDIDNKDVTDEIINEGIEEVVDKNNKVVQE